MPKEFPKNTHALGLLLFREALLLSHDGLSVLLSVPLRKQRGISVAESHWYE